MKLQVLLCSPILFTLSSPIHSKNWITFRSLHKDSKSKDIDITHASYQGHCSHCSQRPGGIGIEWKILIYFYPDFQYYSLAAGTISSGFSISTNEPQSFLIMFQLSPGKMKDLLFLDWAREIMKGQITTCGPSGHMPFLLCRLFFCLYRVSISKSNSNLQENCQNG